MAKKLLSLFLVFSLMLILLSCNKKTTDNNVIKQSNQQNNEQSKQDVNKQNPNTPVAFSVKSVSDATGKAAADFTWMEKEKEVKLSDFRGKVVLVNFWATWCPPCRKELPDLSQLSNDLKNEQFKLIGISVDEDKSTLDRFMSANNLSYTILHEPVQLTEKYMMAGGVNENVIPQSYIVDKNGKIVEAFVGSRSKDEFLKMIKKYL